MTGTLALAVMVLVVVGFLELGCSLTGEPSPVVGPLWRWLRRREK